jgi:hypothetical protein
MFPLIGSLKLAFKVHLKEIIPQRKLVTNIPVWLK